MNAAEQPALSLASFVRVLIALIPEFRFGAGKVCPLYIDMVEQHR